MNVQIKEHLEKYPAEIKEMFEVLRRTIFDSISDEITEIMWARLPSYCANGKFIRIIPFKDHINIEASAVVLYKSELSDYKITPKGMLQIYVHQEIPTEILTGIFAKTLK